MLLNINLFFVIKIFKAMSRNPKISFPRNSQMSPRPIFISDSRDTKEWPCFVGQFFFSRPTLFYALVCSTTSEKKKEANMHSHFQHCGQELGSILFTILLTGSEKI